jgi:hypothetical protein
MPTVLVTQGKTGTRMAYVMQTIAKALPAQPLGVYNRNNLGVSFAIFLQFLEGQKVFEIQNIY